MDGRIGLAGYLVDFIDIDDAARGLFDIIVGGLQKAQDDILHILAHIARFGQRGGVGDGKGHMQHARKGLGQQGFARARGADQQNIALLQLDIVLALAVVDPAVVIVHGNREDFFGLVLPDDILIKKLLDLIGLGNCGLARRKGLALLLFGNNVIAQLDALIADIHRRPGDELFYLFLALAAE